MKRIEAGQLEALAAALSVAGYRVVAPLRDGQRVRFDVWRPGATIDVQDFPINSAKDFLFPRGEIVARYSLDGGGFTPQDVPTDAPKTVLLAVRPCDAAALAVLDAVFNWDTRDVAYNARRAATTIVSLLCARADEHCFCTSVGSAPDSTVGADAVLRPADGGAAMVFEPISEKGKALAAAAGSALADGAARPDPVADVPVWFDVDAVTAWLGENFESPLWQEWSLACLGCGACTYACAACHCFDLQDEASRATAVRLRNWDTCALALFTAHTGGHNPRPDQASRWRQRVMHKFRYLVDLFRLRGCSGCGRCARLCPAGVAILDTCCAIDAASKAKTR